MSFGADVVIDGTGDGHVIYQAGAKYEKEARNTRVVCSLLPFALS